VWSNKIDSVQNNQILWRHLIKKAGFTRKTARTGAVTLIQRFGSALNLNLHLGPIPTKVRNAT